MFLFLWFINKDLQGANRPTGSFLSGKSAEGETALGLRGEGPPGKPQKGLAERWDLSS